MQNTTFLEGFDGPVLNILCEALPLFVENIGTVKPIIAD